MLLVIDIHLFYYAKNANAINIYMFPSHLENYMHGLSDYWALDRGKAFFFSFLQIVKFVYGYNIILRIEIVMQEIRCSQLYQKYRIQGEIGRGASATCYKIQNILTKQHFAMKKIHVTSIKKQNTKEACLEVQILSKLNHPHIIKLYQSFTDETNIYIIMQYASKGDLHHIIKRKKMKNEFYSEQNIWEMAFQLFSAVEYLHKHNIIHRDVKTLNIFMDNQEKLYLGDLGVSKILKVDAGLYSRVGTPLYLAPEIIKYQKYDYKADIWSLGCVLYQIATLNHPFQGKNIISLGQNIVSSSPKYMQKMSIELNQLILDMLQKNPSKRLGASDLLSKYFKDRQNSIPKLTLLLAANRKSAVIPQIQQINQQNKDTEKSKQSNAVRPYYQSKIKHRVHNNYINIGMNNYQNINKQRAQMVEQKRRQQKNVFKERVIGKYIDETVQFTKKISSSSKEQKNYSEMTHKNNQGIDQIVSMDMSFDKNQQEIIKQKPVCQEKKIFSKEKGNFFISQKKLRPHVIASNSSLLNQVQDKKVIDTFTDDHFKRKTQMFSNDNDHFPSYSELYKSSKIQRVRPKSSIMTKQRHQSTMKNIRKNINRDYQHELIQTCYLKKPEMIIL